MGVFVLFVPLYHRAKNSAPIRSAPVPPKHCTPPTWKRIQGHRFITVRSDNTGKNNKCLLCTRSVHLYYFIKAPQQLHDKGPNMFTNEETESERDRTLCSKSPATEQEGQVFNPTALTPGGAAHLNTVVEDGPRSCPCVPWQANPSLQHLSQDQDFPPEEAWKTVFIVGLWHSLWYCFSSPELGLQIFRNMI
jgi:hypothetical protein